MLAMHPDCERCGRDLPAEAAGAFICSMECTFCAACVDGPLAGACPNCGGVLAERPSRVGDLLMRYPASTERHHGR